MSQMPSYLDPSNVGVKGAAAAAAAGSMAGTGGQAAHDAEIQGRFNSVFGYTPTNNYGFGQNYAHESSKEGIGNSCIHLVTFDATDAVEQLSKDYAFEKPVDDNGITKITNFSGIVTDALVEEKNTYYIKLTALLEELPELSFGFDFTEGPGNVAQDNLKQFMSNDMFNAAAELGAVDSSFKNIIKSGLMTNDIWNGVKNSDIKLKFKIYTADTLGQTDPDIWLKALALFATPNTGNQSSIRNYIHNIISGVKNTVGIGQALFNAYDVVDQNRKNTKDKANASKYDYNNRLAKVNSESNIATKTANLEKNLDSMMSFLDTIKDSANDISNILTLRYGHTRVFGEFNRLNCMGEKLWSLYLYDNFLFKRPLTVFVKDWNVKASQEINTIKVDTGSSIEFIQRPVYYEFTLTCALDQTYSIDQWNYVLSDNVQLPYRNTNT